jgi:hypothetical protein
MNPAALAARQVGRAIRPRSFGAARRYRPGAVGRARPAGSAARSGRAAPGRRSRPWPGGAPSDRHPPWRCRPSRECQHAKVLQSAVESLAGAVGGVVGLRRRPACAAGSRAQTWPRGLENLNAGSGSLIQQFQECPAARIIDAQQFVRDDHLQPHACHFLNRKDSMREAKGVRSWNRNPCPASG